MKRFLFLSVIALSLRLRCVRAIDDEPVAVPKQYIVFYKKDADPVITNERLFFSPDSSIASSEDFRVVHEMRKAIAVAGISDEQYQELIQDPSVEKVSPVSPLRADESRCFPMCHTTYGSHLFFRITKCPLTL